MVSRWICQLQLSRNSCYDKIRYAATILAIHTTYYLQLSTSIKISEPIPLVSIFTNQLVLQEELRS